MKDRKNKIELLLSLIRKTQGYLVMFRRDGSGNKVIISKKPIDGDTDIEIELVTSLYSPKNSEDDIQD